MKEKLFKDEKYYRWISDENKRIVFNDNRSLWATHGVVVKGCDLNSTITDIGFGCRIDWQELETEDLDGLLPKIENLSFERCFELMPDPCDKNNKDGLYPIIKEKFLSKGHSGWNVRIHDWYGDKSQACIYDAENKSLLLALQDCIVWLVARGIVDKNVI